MERQSALITGASGGIGSAIARALGERGYQLTLTSRRRDKLEATADELRARGAVVNAIEADLTDLDSISRIIESHESAFGELDVLVNNAGIGAAGPVRNSDVRKLEMQLAINLRAAYALTRDCLPMLSRAGAAHGRALVINMSSIAGKQGHGNLAAYSASKSGLVAFSEALQSEVAEQGIKVTALCPAWVATSMTDWIEGAVPKEEMLTPEDVARAVEFVLETSQTCFIPEIQMKCISDVNGRMATA